MRTPLSLSLCLSVCLGLAATPAPAASPPFVRQSLANDAILLVSEQRQLPIVDIEILLDAGSRRDPKGKEGLANLTADLLNEGTATRNASELAEAVDRLGASLSSSAGIDTASIDLRVLRKDLDAGLALLAEVLLRPAFPAGELTRRREAVLAAMQAAEDQPGWLAYRAFIGSVFGDEPYGHLVEGTPEAVAAITRRDVLEFYRRNYAPQRSIITVVGDVGTDEIAAKLNHALATWSGSDAEAFAYPQVAATQPSVRRVEKPLSQTSIVLGHRGIARDNPDFFAVTVMNYILGGGGFGSRLMDTIRTEGGLTYSVSSSFATPKNPGSFRVGMQTKKESTAEALRLTCRELLRIRKEMVSDAELEGAKLYLTGNFPLQLDSNRKIAGFLSSLEFFGLGSDYAETYLAGIAAVTKEDVLRVAKKHVRPEEFHLVLVGDIDWDDSKPLDCGALAAGEKPPA